MKKTELIEAIAKEFELIKSKAEKILNAFLDKISKALKKEDSIIFKGFRSFSVKRRKARKGRNPATGDKIKIPARKAITFKAGAKLKELLNRKKK